MLELPPPRLRRTLGRLHRQREELSVLLERVHLHANVHAGFRRDDRNAPEVHRASDVPIWPQLRIGAQALDKRVRHLLERALIGSGETGTDEHQIRYALHGDHAVENTRVARDELGLWHLRIRIVPRRQHGDPAFAVHATPVRCSPEREFAWWPAGSETGGDLDPEIFEALRVCRQRRINVAAGDVGHDAVVELGPYGEAVRRPVLSGERQTTHRQLFRRRPDPHDAPMHVDTHHKDLEHSWCGTQIVPGDLRFDDEVVRCGLGRRVEVHAHRTRGLLDVDVEFLENVAVLLHMEQWPELDLDILRRRVLVEILGKRSVLEHTGGRAPFDVQQLAQARSRLPAQQVQVRRGETGELGQRHLCADYADRRVLPRQPREVRKRARAGDAGDAAERIQPWRERSYNDNRDTSGLRTPEQAASSPLREGSRVTPRPHENYIG